jgi:cytochrome c peroxidase
VPPGVLGPGAPAGRVLLGAIVAASVGACEGSPAPAGDVSPPPVTSAAAVAIRSEPLRPIPQADPMGPRSELGRKLFFDRRLSRDGTVGCGSCHDLFAAGGADELALSVGVGGKKGLVNSLTVLNALFNDAFFWDGRATSLEHQVGFPLTDPNEMGSTWVDALATIRADPDYVAAFAALYGDGITEENVRKAIASYERTLATPSRFDAWLEGDGAAITAEERRGYEIFKSIGCVACHQGRNVGGNMFQRFGVMGDYFADRGKVAPSDYGRYNVTKKDDDKFVFRVPSLRNVAKTAPYFHDGSAPTLPDAIRTMARYQLGRPLPDGDVALIAGFLATLTGTVPADRGDPKGGG